jgi:o-succinylbenzoate synthase
VSFAQMKLESIIARELRMPLKAPFETSFGSTSIRRVLLIEVKAEGLSGWGEITTVEEPFYNSETTDTAWSVLSDFIVPIVLGKRIGHASDLHSLLAHIRGHEMARAGVETALWDVEAKARAIPLSRLLGGTRATVDCGVSIGIQAGETALFTAIDREVRAGYQRIKLKIKPGSDIKLLSAARRVFPHTRMMADANSAYTLDDTHTLQQLDDFGLMMIEQPLYWDDIYEHSLLQRKIRTPICLDESIHSARHARTALDLGACKIINVKLGRVGGFAEAIRLQAFCQERGVPVWCGGMLESGVGRAHNIALSTLPGFSLPGDISASSRYWEEDIVDPPIDVTPAGTINVPTTPGLGYEPSIERIERLTVCRRDWICSRN